MRDDSTNYQIAVSLACGVPAGTRAALEQIIRDTLLAHMHNAPENLFGHADLEVTIQQCGTDDEGETRAKLQLSGQVNGIPVKRSFSGTAGVMGEAGLSLILFGVINVFVVLAAFPLLALSSVMKRRLERKQWVRNEFEQTIEVCTVKICLFLDRTVGRSASPLSQRWQMIQWTRWIVFAAVLLWLTAQEFAGRNQPFEFEDLMMFWMFRGLLPSFAAFGLVHFAGLCCMPAHFFLDDPAGRRERVRSGIQDLKVLQKLALFLTLFFAAVLMSAWPR